MVVLTRYQSYRHLEPCTSKSSELGDGNVCSLRFYPICDILGRQGKHLKIAPWARGKVCRDLVCARFSSLWKIPEKEFQGGKTPLGPWSPCRVAPCIRAHGQAEYHGNRKHGEDCSYHCNQEAKRGKWWESQGQILSSKACPQWPTFSRQNRQTDRHIYTHTHTHVAHSCNFPIMLLVSRWILEYPQMTHL